jgi:HEAT repeat protein
MQYSGYMTDMMRLIGAHDDRAAPIFRKGLSSNNPYVVLESVLGLADLGNPSDIDPIIEVADRSEADIDSGVATALARFRNPRDRALIAKRLEGSRLYDGYVIAVKADDQIIAEGKVKPN